MAELKKSFFRIILIESSEGKEKEKVLKHLKNVGDFVLSKIGNLDSEESFVKYFKNIVYLTIFIKCSNRKRAAQIKRYCESEDVMNSVVKSYLSADWNAEIKKCKYSEDYNSCNIQAQPKGTSYTRKDIKILDNIENWHPWQKDIYKMMFNVNEIDPKTRHEFSEPEERAIISLVDFVGNSGKSTFWKWILDKYGDDIATISYGTAGQLRSRAVNVGPKKAYLLDLPRSRGKMDATDDLLSVIEDLKSGKIDSSYYGSSSTLLFDRPHVLISSNFEFDYLKLSGDRWKVFILKDKKLHRKSIKVAKSTESLKKSLDTLIEA